ncbi:MAG: hypothetical protein WAN65_28080 [Candidatus Sulfotelmatobacter sp.]
MLFRLLTFIRRNPNNTIAIITGAGILIFALVDPAWWGKAGFGLLVGIAASVPSVLILWVLDDYTTIDAELYVPWALVLVPTGVALLLRRAWKQDHFQPWVVNVSLSASAIPPPQTILLIVVGLLLLILIAALIHSLSRGEAVSVDSHWGGLGGGIAGWRLSAPLVYLLGIAFLLAVSSALAWRVFTASAPSPQAGQQSSLPANSTANPGSRTDAVK